MHQYSMVIYLWLVLPDIVFFSFFLSSTLFFLPFFLFPLDSIVNLLLFKLSVVLALLIVVYLTHIFFIDWFIINCYFLLSSSSSFALFLSSFSTILLKTLQVFPLLALLSSAHLLLSKSFAHLFSQFFWCQTYLNTCIINWNWMTT